MSKFLDILRKLGIFRSGAVSGTYTNAVNRPSELQMEGVYDAKKDLVNKNDVENVKQKLIDGNKPDPDKATTGRKIVFFLVLLIGTFILLGQLASGFSFNLIITFILWIILFFYLKKFAFLGYYSFLPIIIISVVVILISLMIAAPNSNNSSTSNTGTLTDASFDKKVLKITSADGSVRGTIGLTKKKNRLNKDYLVAVYNLVIKTGLPMTKCAPNAQGCKGTYTYAGRLVPIKQTGTKTSNGGVSAVYCNKDKLETDVYNISGTVHDLKTCGVTVTDGVTTDTFDTSFQTNFYSYAEILKTTGFEVYDSSSFWEQKPGDSSVYTNKTDKTVQNSSPIKSLNFIVSE